jgi:hypothetical protein
LKLLSSIGFQPQVSPSSRVCFNEVNPLREQLEYALHEALQRERKAWSDLEQAARPADLDDTRLRACRERWQTTAHALVTALRALKR